MLCCIILYPFFRQLCAGVLLGDHRKRFRTSRVLCHFCSGSRIPHPSADILGEVHILSRLGRAKNENLDGTSRARVLLFLSGVLSEYNDAKMKKQRHA